MSDSNYDSDKWTFARETQEQTYREWQRTRGSNSFDEEVDAAVAFVRSCLHPQASPGREWERDVKVKMTCGAWRVTLRTNDVNSIYGLTINGRWLPWSEWCRLPDSETDFPTQAAARAALAQVPDPRELTPSSEVGRWIVDEHGWIRSMNMSGPAAIVKHKSWAQLLVNDANLGAALSRATDPRTSQVSPASDKEGTGTYIGGVLHEPVPASDKRKWCARCGRGVGFWEAADVSPCSCPEHRAPPPASEAERPKSIVDALRELQAKCINAGEHDDAYVIALAVEELTKPTPADAGSVSVPREVRVGSDSWRLDAKPRSDGGVTINVGSDHSGYEIDLSAADRSRLAAALSALSAPSPSPATTARAGFTYPDEAVDKVLRSIKADTHRYGPNPRLLRDAAALRAARVTLPPTPPATVQVPLELAREVVDRDRPIRQHLERDELHARLYDVLAAGVKEADRIAKKEMSP